MAGLHSMHAPTAVQALFAVSLDALAKIPVWA